MVDFLDSKHNVIPHAIAINGWDFLRQVLTFLAGIIILIYGVLSAKANHPDLTVATGLVLMGIVPVDRLFTKGS